MNTLMSQVHIYKRRYQFIDEIAEAKVKVIIHMDHDVDEPWPLQIFDHCGHLHEVFLEPQQFVLFESEKCVSLLTD